MCRQCSLLLPFHRCPEPKVPGREAHFHLLVVASSKQSASAPRGAIVTLWPLHQCWGQSCRLTSEAFCKFPGLTPWPGSRVPVPLRDRLVLRPIIVIVNYHHSVIAFSLNLSLRRPGSERHSQDSCLAGPSVAPRRRNGTAFCFCVARGCERSTWACTGSAQGLQYGIAPCTQVQIGFDALTASSTVVCSAAQHIVPCTKVLCLTPTAQEAKQKHHKPKAKP